MAKLIAFNFLTLNGYYKGPDGDISWHRHGGEEGEYSADMLSQDNILVFGRTTYEMMAGYWPGPMAAENDPVVAQGMNQAEKIVFSRTLQQADWNNTRIISDNLVDTVALLKNGSKDMAVLGSGSLITQLASAGLIDEYQIMIDPVAIGHGTTIFQGMDRQLALKLTGAKVFNSGVVLLHYVPG